MLQLQVAVATKILLLYPILRTPLNQFSWISTRAGKKWTLDIEWHWTTSITPSLCRNRAWPWSYIDRRTSGLQIWPVFSLKMICTEKMKGTWYSLTEKTVGGCDYWRDWLVLQSPDGKTPSRKIYSWVHSTVLESISVLQQESTRFSRFEISYQTFWEKNPITL